MIGSMYVFPFLEKQCQRRMETATLLVAIPEEDPGIKATSLQYL